MLGAALSLTDTAIRSRGRPAWVPSGASAFWDFANDRYWRAPYSIARASAKHAENSAGVYSSFAADTLARTDKGALIEPARTNLCLRSQEFDNASWTGDATVTANTDAAPDGTVTADRIEDASTSANAARSQQVAIQDDSNWVTFSIFVKKDTDETRFPEFQLLLLNGTTNPRRRISLSTKTGATAIVASDGTVSSRVDDYGGHWRVVINCQNNSTGNTGASVVIYPARAASLGGPIENAVTGSIIFWGAQIEENASDASSYIATTDVAATRAADSLTLQLPSGTHALTFTFDDGSAQVIAGASGAYALPVNLNRPWIKTVKAVRA